MIRIANSDQSEEGKRYVGTLDVVLILVNMSTYILVFYQLSSRCFTRDEPIFPEEDEASAKKDNETNDVVESRSTQDIEMGSSVVVFEKSKQKEQILMIEEDFDDDDGIIEPRARESKTILF